MNAAYLVGAIIFTILLVLDLSHRRKIVKKSRPFNSVFLVVESAAIIFFLVRFIQSAL